MVTMTRASIEEERHCCRRRRRRVVPLLLDHSPSEAEEIRDLCPSEGKERVRASLVERGSFRGGLFLGARCHRKNEEVVKVERRPRPRPPFFSFFFFPFQTPRFAPALPFDALSGRFISHLLCVISLDGFAGIELAEWE